MAWLRAHRLGRHQRARRHAAADHRSPVRRDRQDRGVGRGADLVDSFGIDPGAEPPDDFAALVRAKYAQMGEVIRTMGIKVE